MNPAYDRDGITLYQGDSLKVLAEILDESIHACVTDPPYGLSFMNKAWDYDVPKVELWREVHRVLKPGAHLLSFFGTRTYHRGVVQIEDAGFDIRDQLAWVYGSGFPKSLDVSKAVDKMAPRVGMFDKFALHYAERRKSKGITHSAICEAGHFYENHNHGGASVNWENGANVPTMKQWLILAPMLELSNEWLPLIERVETKRKITGKQKQGKLAVAPGQGNDRSQVELDITAPATDPAKEWDGWGTALKPAWEPICLARKPLTGTVAENVQEHGTGAINVDGCRIGTGGDKITGGISTDSKGLHGGGIKARTQVDQSVGRWPANLCHDGSEEVLEGFPFTQSGTILPHHVAHESENRAMSGENYERTGKTSIGDSGSAARFFYCAKPTQTERDSGLEGQELKTPGEMTDRKDGRPGTDNPRAGAGRSSGGHNFHPTVKPLDLMRWLVRLVTPPGGQVLDPFLGSGTAAIAAYHEGFQCIGVEISQEYMDDICIPRIKQATSQQRLF